jgi:glutamate synthase (NADPH/NADH) small chain
VGEQVDKQVENDKQGETDGPVGEKRRPRRETKPTKEPMPRQDPKARGKNFNEVALGYRDEQAVSEADRCLSCKKKPCIAGCPVEIDIPEFIGLVAKRDFRGAARKLKEKNSLPAICGRVCPQEEQCERVCVLAKKYEPVAIGRLERFVADWELAHGVEIPKSAPPTGKSVAVVGSGPAGLTVAGDLAKLGHRVVIFEALHKPGGVLVYGIPEFRLPKAIVAREVEYVTKLGVEIRVDHVIGRIYTIEELMKEEGFDAVYVCTGAGLPYFMNIPGENLAGVYSANEFLTRSNLMKAYDFERHKATPIRVGRRVVVVGGGNVAMDASRTALRLGADEVRNVYRRSRLEMPARAEEIENAEDEGIILELLTNPVEILGDDKGRVRGVRCIRMELGEPDASGRRRPVPIEGSEFELECQTLVMAIGNGANPLISRTTPSLEVNRWGYIVVNEATGATNIPGVYAGGDIVRGAATVILAMGDGRTSARAIHEYLSKE